MENSNKSPMAYESIGKLLVKFSVPSIISFLVNAIYNIVDQIFIGQGVGMYGNAATNVAFPLTTICTALSLLIGIGGASNFNLDMGRGNQENAANIAGNAFTLMVLSGIILSAAVSVFLRPLMLAFGATEKVLPLAIDYTRIIAVGMPFLIFSTASSQLIRADGSPMYSMLCVLSGAAVNTVLDPIFIFKFNMGVSGAALATILGQMLSCALAVRYVFRFHSVKLRRAHFYIKARLVKMIASLGAAACFNQFAMMAVQITMNNILTYYGAMSRYGSDIPLACVGVITKVNILYIGFVLGVAQGCQPIVGFNYGAGNYDRVRRTFLTGTTVATIISGIAFLCFRFFPREIISIFGEGSSEYFDFAIRYFRIFMFMTFMNGLQPMTANFFTSIGKAKMGILISMTRQIIFLLPLIVILPRFFGIDGIMFAGPIADGAAALVAGLLIIREFRIINSARTS